MFAVVTLPWLTRPSWVRSEDRFLANDPWNENRITFFTVEAYVPTLTGKPLGPWPKGYRLWVTPFRYGLRSEADGTTRWIPESLSDLWLSGQVALHALPWMLKEIEPTLNHLDYRGTPSSQVPILSMSLEWIGCAFGIGLAILLGFTAHGSFLFRWFMGLWIGGVIVLLGYPSVTIKRYRARRQTRWFLEQMRTRSEPLQSEPGLVADAPLPIADAASSTTPSASTATTDAARSASIQSGIKSIAEIQAEFDRVTALIGAKKYWATLPSFDPAQRYSRTRIEVDAAGYHFLCNDRGNEFEFAVTTDFDKILFWSFKQAVILLASDYAREHQIPGQDRRRLSHPRGIELFALISPDCAERWKAEIATSLKIHPYDNAYDLRIDLQQQLIRPGTRGDEAWRMVLERYPAKTPNQALRPF